ncbi:MAG: hypothetical protein U5S82_17630 [Gammaproteobacteria bacterium]|nr:hypothetical protein [Gammaproteobacteria bacterium]
MEADAGLFLVSFQAATLLPAYSEVVFARPAGGDALTFVAGFMKVRFDVFILLTGCGEGMRYVFLPGLVNWFYTTL